MPRELVEVYGTPYVKAEAEGEHLYYYGHGFWIEDDTSGLPEAYIVGGDGGVYHSSQA